MQPPSDEPESDQSQLVPPPHPAPPVAPGGVWSKYKIWIIVAGTFGFLVVLCCVGSIITGLMNNGGKREATGLDSPSAQAPTTPIVSTTAPQPSQSSAPPPTTAPAPPPPPAPIAPAALSLNDPANDMDTGNSTGNPPAWADLRNVTWQRTATGATITFTTAGPIPTKLPGTDHISFAMYVDQGETSAYISARLEGTTWRIRASIGDELTTISTTPRVTGAIVAYDLPNEIKPGDGSIDLTMRSQTRAEATGSIQKADGMSLLVFTDYCSPNGQPDSMADW